MAWHAAVVKFVYANFGYSSLAYKQPGRRNSPPHFLELCSRVAKRSDDHELNWHFTLAVILSLLLHIGGDYREPYIDLTSTQGLSRCFGLLMPVLLRSASRMQVKREAENSSSTC